MNPHLKILKTPSGDFVYYDITSLKEAGLPDPQRLPFSLKLLLENALRHVQEGGTTFDEVAHIARWTAKTRSTDEVSFFPGRVILQDFTGVPCIVDLAAMRSAMQRLNADYKKINPLVPCDLIIDHSLQIDSFGTPASLAVNLKNEYARNRERYEFLKWGQKNFDHFRVIPPGTGIIHQINLEYLAQGLLRRQIPQGTLLYPDTCIGTDSHTTMINGLGVLGWGVGGIEAEAVILGEPLGMLVPEVVGVRLTGRLNPKVTATDLVLTITQRLRAKGVVGKFVEFFGSGLRYLSLPDRATISNMAPEYGATIGIFPVDRETLNYYRLTGRSSEGVDLLELYLKQQGMLVAEDQNASEFSEVMELDLGSVVPSVAGPKRPQDRVDLTELKNRFHKDLLTPVKERGYGLQDMDLAVAKPLNKNETLRHGSVVLASITSCTNTSNPALLIGAGLLARNAVFKGLKVPSYVKTSFAPGSTVVEEYLNSAGLLRSFEDLGFHIVGYGCATCIGNSGPLPEAVTSALKGSPLVVASVLSGNRNFEGRIHPLVKANYLASPLLVVAFALAGRIDIDLERDPLGTDQKGHPVFLRDLWPDQQDIDRCVGNYVNAQAFRKRYQNVMNTPDWDKVKLIDQDLFRWNKKSTYIQEPPYLLNLIPQPEALRDIIGARVLAKLGDSITTDHISPAGAIHPASPAGQYLQKLGVPPTEFNSYGSRRGNDKVMTRGTFANLRLRNQLVPGTEGPETVHFPTGEKMTIYDAAQKYLQEKIPSLIIAGKEYGTGSSRDWAAKGVALLGVRAVLAESYERIHRSNLIGMGVLPLMFREGDSAERLGLRGDETFYILDLEKNISVRGHLQVRAVGANGKSQSFEMLCRLDTPRELEYYRNGGILPTVLRKFLS